MSRIARTFEKLAASQRRALIPFVTAGDPDPAQTVAVMHALVKGGADVIELGVPFSDPMADGPVIQRASERALRKGTTLRHVLGFVREFRKADAATPVVLMGYLNPIERMGYPIDVFHKGVGCRRCRNTGFSGRIGIHELLNITDELRDAIINDPSIGNIREIAHRRGMITLRQDGFRKVREGITTVEEVLQVAGGDRASDEAETPAAAQ